MSHQVPSTDSHGSLSSQRKRLLVTCAVCPVFVTFCDVGCRLLICKWTKTTHRVCVCRAPGRAACRKKEMPLNVGRWCACVCVCEHRGGLQCLKCLHAAGCESGGVSRKIECLSNTSTSLFLNSQCCFFSSFHQLHLHAFPFGAVNRTHLQSSVQLSLQGCFARCHRKSQQTEKNEKINKKMSFRKKCQ